MSITDQLDKFIIFYAYLRICIEKKRRKTYNQIDCEFSIDNVSIYFFHLDYVFSVHEQNRIASHANHIMTGAQIEWKKTCFIRMYEHSAFLLFHLCHMKLISGWMSINNYLWRSPIIAYLCERWCVLADTISIILRILDRQQHLEEGHFSFSMAEN